MRKRIFNIIDQNENNNISKAYDLCMLLAIIASIIPLMFKQSTHLLRTTEKITVIIFILDYVLRWFTADFKIENGLSSFLKYPFTLYAIIDLISILASFSIVGKTFKIIRLVRVFKTFRIFKIFKYSKNFELVCRVIKKEKDVLIAVLTIALTFLFISALIMFSVEPESFDSFFDSLYWATTALTTVGYGDIYPITKIGKIISMVSSFFGIAVIALPAGVITAGFLEELKNK